MNDSWSSGDDYLLESDVMDKWNSWLADITFNWCDIVGMAVERNNKTCRFTTFLHCLFYRIRIKTSQLVDKNNVKIECKYKRWI